jgi:hypothetical protein
MIPEIAKSARDATTQGITGDRRQFRLNTSGIIGKAKVAQGLMPGVVGSPTITAIGSNTPVQYRSTALPRSMIPAGELAFNLIKS